MRQNLLLGLLQYRELLDRCGYTEGIQLVDGSFVENVEIRESRDPGDIDVFSFLVRPSSFRQDSAKWAAVGYPIWVLLLMDPNKNKKRFGLDTYGLAVDQNGPLRLIDETIYWYSLFSHKRVTHEWKGFLRVPLNPVDDATAKAALVTGP